MNELVYATLPLQVSRDIAFNIVFEETSEVDRILEVEGPVIPRKTEFSYNRMSPTPQPNIEKNVISFQMFLFLNSGVTL